MPKTTRKDFYSGLCESRRPTLLEARSEIGRSSVLAVCPFCNNQIEGFVWSLHSSGKSCACGALWLCSYGHHSFYRRKQECETHN